MLMRKSMGEEEMSLEYFWDVKVYISKKYKQPTEDLKERVRRAKEEVEFAVLSDSVAEDLRKKFEEEERKNQEAYIEEAVKE